MTTARLPAARAVTTTRYAHGEGLRWDAARGELLWVDIGAGRVLRARPDALDAPVVHQLDRPVGAVAPRAAGGWVAGAGRGFVTIAEDGSTHVVRDVEPAGVRMNDGACDPRGRFWCGSMAEDERPGAGTLHVLEVDGSVTTAASGLTISNGLGWSPDGTTAYLDDSGVGVTWVLDLDEDSGLPRTQRVLVEHDTGVGDGLTVDADGYLWVALWGGSAVHRYDPAGRLVARVEVPARDVTSCCLADGVLYATTASKGLAAPGPGDGLLYAAEVGVDAPPVATYAG